MSEVGLENLVGCDSSICLRFGLREGIHEASDDMFLEYHFLNCRIFLFKGKGASLWNRLAPIISSFPSKDSNSVRPRYMQLCQW